MNDRVRHFYRKFRDHQNTLAVEDRGGLTIYANGRVEVTYGPAPYGEHAASALAAAKRHVFFLADLKKELRK